MSERSMSQRPPLSIDHLVSPLRLDVQLRGEYFAELSALNTGQLGDLDRCVDLAYDSNYWIWFRTVAVGPIGISLDDPVALRKGFRRRVKKTVDLFIRYLGTGFDVAYPIEIRHVPDAVTETGKCLTDRLYPTDGCHRLALLALSGNRFLPGEFYRFVNPDRPVRDNTAPLLNSLNYSTSKYFEFLCKGYGLPGLSSVSEISGLRGLSEEERSEITDVASVDLEIIKRRQSI